MKRLFSFMLPRASLQSFFVLIFCLIAFPAFAQFQNTERIVSFHSSIKVNHDSTLTVTETIEVVSLGQQIKRGIFRDFPTRYQDRLGNYVVVGFHVLSVRRDDALESYHVKDWANGKRLYIGSSDRFISRGTHTYQIIYQTTRQLGFFPDHDELYWNVTGTGWIFPIMKVSATVELPGDAASKIIETAAYTGYQGQRGQSYEVSKDLFGNVKFETTAPLLANQGLTIGVAWPKGYVQAPTLKMKVGYFIDDNKGVIYVGLCFLVMLMYYWIAWWMVGRDPKKGTIIPLFQPPQDLSPAAMRYLWKMGYDNQVFSVAVINLAVKGHIRIEETVPLGTINILNLGKTYTLKRGGPEKEAASPEEKKVLIALLGATRDELVLDNEHYVKISGAIDRLKETLETEVQRANFRTNQGYFFVGLLLSIGIAVLTIQFLSSSELSGLFAAVIGFLTVGINILFHRILKAPTGLGRKLLDQLEGFRRYLSVTEKDRMNFLNPPEKTPELFEKYLPYALALDVDQKWSEQFSDVLAKAANGRDYSPSWYTGDSWSYRHPGRFCSNLSGGFTSTIAASAHAPGSSSGGGFSGGGGGGGFSGGGGGGGGGGGW